MIMTKGKTGRERHKQFRDAKRKAGFVHLQAWVKHEHRNLVKQFIKSLQSEAAS